MNEIQTIMDKTEQEAAGLNMDLSRTSTRVGAMKDAVSSKVDALKKEDREKGYYCLTVTKPKNVVFPKPFDGVLGSNVYKFRKEIVEAIDSAQVKEDEKVKMLRKYLRRDARRMVEEFHPGLVQETGWSRIGAGDWLAQD